MSATSFARSKEAADFLLARTALRPAVGLVLGSGLGAFADELQNASATGFADIPNFPRSTAEGHAGRFVVGNVGDVPVAVMAGRVHFYEGYPMEQVVFPIRVMRQMGVRAVVLTNAAGGIREKLEQGCLVVLNDHINLQGVNPMSGPNEARFGVRFFDMTTAYDPAYRALAIREGTRLGIPMHEGVYVAVAGPSYETPAEIRAFRALGADVVGMSTVPEVIVARHMGMRVLAISCVTNLAAGIGDRPLDHKEVLETGARIRLQFIALLKSLLPQVAASVRDAVPPAPAL